MHQPRRPLQRSKVTRGNPTHGSTCNRHLHLSTARGHEFGKVLAHSRQNPHAVILAQRAEEVPYHAPLGLCILAHQLDQLAREHLLVLARERRRREDADQLRVPDEVRLEGAERSSGGVQSRVLGGGGVERRGVGAVDAVEVDGWLR